MESSSFSIEQSVISISFFIFIILAAPAPHTCLPKVACTSSHGTMFHKICHQLPAKPQAVLFKGPVKRSRKHRLAARAARGHFSVLNCQPLPYFFLPLNACIPWRFAHESREEMSEEFGGRGDGGRFIGIGCQLSRDLKFSSSNRPLAAL